VVHPGDQAAAGAGQGHVPGRAPRVCTPSAS
jgi:hypothetical protein